ncbi:probable protein flp at N-terminal half [Coccomyxa sp. Obi]|nr:probable protein flp at N-terminal half [Coccomyxa sp. Obi]
MRTSLPNVSWILGLVVTSILVHSISASPETSVSTDPNDARATNETNRALNRLSESRVFSGAVAVQKNGKLVFSEPFGSASEELDVPLRDTHIFPVGANTKFFTAVAIYQLQEKGLLNVTDPVNSYIEPGDFGLPLIWCPMIHDKEQLGCQEPTIKQMLQMSSGLLPTDDLDCGVSNSTWSDSEWFWQYRGTDWDLKWGDAMGLTGPWLAGNASHLDLLKFQEALGQPLLFAPGSKYCYTNTNYHIAGYIVEKLANMPFGSYLEENILKPANLSNTFYWTGMPGGQPGGLRKGIVPLPGYMTTFEGGSGPAKFKQVNRVTWFPGQLSTQAQAAGALFSNMHDLLRWYNLVLTQPEVIGLSKQSVVNLTEPLQAVPGTNASYAQGLVVSKGPAQETQLTHNGGIWGFQTQITVWVNAVDASKSDAVVVFSNLNPVIPFGMDGSCSVLSPEDGSKIDLNKNLCGNQEGASTTSYVTDQLANIWGMPVRYSSA